MLISQWKNKGGFKISYQELREQLGVNENEYQIYRDFKRRILLPVQKELENKADCWFNCTASGFEQRIGLTLTYLNFKVIFPVLEQEANENRDKLIHWLKSSFKLNGEHIKHITPFLNQLTNEKYNALVEKCCCLVELYYKRLRGDNPIEDLPAYIATTVINELTN